MGPADVWDGGSRPRSSPVAPSGPAPRRHRFASLNTRVAAVLVALIVVGGVVLIDLELFHRPAPANTTPQETHNFPTPIQHVIVIFMEDQDLGDVLTNGSFERYLATHYAFASGYYGLTSDSLKNYEYATSGDEGDPNASNLANLVNTTGESWMAYIESMPTPCDPNSTVANTTLPASEVGNQTDHLVYDTNHDPWVEYNYRFIGKGNQTAYCDQHVVNLSQWNTTLTSGALPNYAWITPNDTNDDHECPACPEAIAHGDAWLRGFLNPFLNSSYFRNSVVLLAYDYNSTEALPNGQPDNVPAPVYMVAISPWAHLDFTSNVGYNDFNILTTTEWLLGLGHTGHNDNWPQNPPMTDLFDFAATYVVSGTVTNNGSPVAGASVGGDGYDVITGMNGTFELPLPNGTYSFSASLSHGTCYGSPQGFTVAGGPTIADFRLSCA